jgi:hypothetical protein
MPQWYKNFYFLCIYLKSKKVSGYLGINALICISYTLLNDIIISKNMDVLDYLESTSFKRKNITNKFFNI